MTRVSMAASLALLGSSVFAAAAFGQERGERYLMPPIPAFRTSQAAVPPNFVLRVEPRQVAEALPVFELLPVDPESLRGIPRGLGLEDGTVLAQDGELSVRGATRDGAPARVTIFEASGGFHYAVANALGGASRTPPNLPSPEEAHKIAVEFLSQRGFMPADARVDFETASFASADVSERDKDSGDVLQEFAAVLEVRFAQRWGDFPVIGPGSKLYVAIGDEGRVVSVTRAWREARATDVMLKPLSAEEALAAIADSPANASFPAYCATAEITSFDLAYWSGSPRAAQRVGLPVYSLKGDCLGVRGEPLGDFEAFAPAARGGPVGAPSRTADPVVDPDEGG